MALRTEYADEYTWTRLAKERGIRLPRHSPCTTGKITRWLKKMGWTPAQFCEWGGFKRMSDWITLNPDWSIRALAGILLEFQASTEMTLGADAEG